MVNEKSICEKIELKDTADRLSVVELISRETRSNFRVENVSAERQAHHQTGGGW